MAYRDGGAGVEDLLATDEPISGVHGDGADGVLSQMLCDLENDADVMILHLERRQDGREASLELDVDDGTNDGGDGPNAACACEVLRLRLSRGRLGGEAAGGAGEGGGRARVNASLEAVQRCSDRR